MKYKMGELLLLTTIVTLVILTIRRGKPIVLDNPLIIHRPGKYHATLAPQLNRAQNFIEAIVRRITDDSIVLADTEVICFAVYDKQVAAVGEQMYLLAVASRGGVLYFQAINPQPLLSDDASHYRTLYNFAADVLVAHPSVASSNSLSQSALSGAVCKAALSLKIKLESLPD